MTKICTKCSKEQDLSSFAKSSKHPDGLTYWCRKCFSAWHRNKTCTEIVTEKRCLRCSIIKPAKDFSKSTHAKDGLQKWCSSCRHEHYIRNRKQIRKYWKRRLKENPDLNISRHLKRNYGLTKEQFNQMVKNQNGRCAICSATSPGGTYKTWHVDHDHETNKIRGLLCNRCNFALGLVKDDIFLLFKLIEYLKKHSVHPKNSLPGCP